MRSPDLFGVTCELGSCNVGSIEPEGMKKACNKNGLTIRKTRAKAMRAEFASSSKEERCGTDFHIPSNIRTASNIPTTAAIFQEVSSIVFGGRENNRSARAGRFPSLIIDID